MKTAPYLHNYRYVDIEYRLFVYNFGRGHGGGRQRANELILYALAHNKKKVKKVKKNEDCQNDIRGNDLFY